MRTTKLLTPLLLLAVAAPARAATFTITIKNTSSVYMAPGVLTLSPLLAIGPAPNPGTKQFATYEYTRYDCDVPDQYCASNSSAWCWFANETTLIERWGLTKGVDAWIPSPPGTLPFFGIPVFEPGDSTTVTITAQPGQKLSYVTKAGDFTTYVDQNVMMHAPGDPANLQVDLFDADGFPKPYITFDLGGYTVSSSSPTDGTARQCANYCPGAGGQTTGCYVALGSAATGPLLPAQPAAPTLGTGWAWSAPEGYTTDGMALGDLTSSAGNEILVELEGEGASSNTNGVGRAVVFANGGTVLSSFDSLVAGHDLMGFPMIENLNGGTYSEYLVSEFAPATPTPAAAVYARSGDSATAVWTSTNYGYPGMWNMGPSAGDVRSDNTGNEVVIADYDGDIVVLKESDATTLNTYNLYASNNDHLYGHAAIGNVDGNTKNGNEIVVVGADTGRAYVFNAKTGSGVQPLTLEYTSDAPLNGGVAAASGAAIADVDGDKKLDVIVATANVGGVYVYTPASGNTACKYKWSNPGGADYSFSSPVVGDVDGDGKPEIIVFSSDAVLSVLEIPTAGTTCKEGTVAWTYSVGNGGPAWFTPALADLIDDSASTRNPALEVVVANYNTLEVLHPIAKSVAFRVNDNTANFYPSALIERGTTSATASIYVPGWINGKVTKYTTPAGTFLPATNWSSFMGGNTRTGAR